MKLITSMSVNGRNENRSGKSGLDGSSSSSNVLRRMFKSKSKTRTASSNLLSNGHTSQKRHHSSAAGCANPVLSVNEHSPVHLELVDSQLALFLSPASVFDTHALRRFLDAARPHIRNERVHLAYDRPTHDNCFELLNVYLHSVNVQCREPKRRSKLDQHRMEKTRLSAGSSSVPPSTQAGLFTSDEDECVNGVFYFLKCRLGFDGFDGEWEHLTSLFKPNEPVNDLIQLRIDE